ncbi:unnamed protein product [Closterium sp. NIES-53]
MLREPLLPSTGGRESNTRVTSDSAESHEFRARVNLTIPRGAATANGPPPNRRASVDSANVTISEGSDLCAEADPRSRRISFGNERGEAGGSGRRGRWGSGGAGGGEGLRSPRSPGLSKQEVLGAFDAAEAEEEEEADLSAHLQTDFQTVLNTVGAHPSQPRSPSPALHPSLSSTPSPPLSLLPSLSSPRSPPLALLPSLSSPRSPPLALVPLCFEPSMLPDTLQSFLPLPLRFPQLTTTRSRLLHHPLLHHGSPALPCFKLHALLPHPFLPLSPPSSPSSDYHSSLSPSARPSSPPLLVCSAVRLITYPLSHPFRPLLPPQMVLAFCTTLFCTAARLLCPASSHMPSRLTRLPPSPQPPPLPLTTTGHETGSATRKWAVSEMGGWAVSEMGGNGLWHVHFPVPSPDVLLPVPPLAPSVRCARQVMVAVLFESWGVLSTCAPPIPLLFPMCCLSPSLPRAPSHVLCLACPHQVMVAVLFEFWGALGMYLIIVWPPLLSHVCPTHSLPCVRHVCVHQVMVAVLFEFWGALGMCLIIVWQSALIFLPPLPTLCIPSFATSAAAASAPSAAPLCLLPRHLVIAASLALVIPTVLVRSFARLTNVALSGVASSTLLCSVMLGTWASDPSSSALPDPRAHHHSTVSWSHLPMAAGIFMVSLSGHAGLPSLRRSMRTPQHFDQCIIVTFSSMFLLYATMGGFAYLYFGDSVRVLVTASLDDAGAAAGIILLQWGSVSVSLSALLSLLVAASVFTTIPALVYVMSELILDLSARLGLPVSSHKPAPSAVDPVADGAESVCPADGGLPLPQCSAQPVSHRHSAIAEGITRLAVTFVGYITAYLTYDVLDRVESVVGGVCSVGVSMVLPAVIFDRLYSHQLSVLQLTLLRGLIAFGVVAACGIAYINIFK